MSFSCMKRMTGAAIIRLMEERECHRDNVSDDECKAIYAKKAEYFTALGKVGQIQGTARMLNTLRDADIARVLVTGSGQATLLDRLNADYPGIFSAPLKRDRPRCASRQTRPRTIPYGNGQSWSAAMAVDRD